MILLLRVFSNISITLPDLFWLGILCNCFYPITLIPLLSIFWDYYILGVILKKKYSLNLYSKSNKIQSEKLCIFQINLIHFHFYNFHAGKQVSSKDKTIIQDLLWNKDIFSEKERGFTICRSSLRELPKYVGCKKQCLRGKKKIGKSD